MSENNKRRFLISLLWGGVVLVVLLAYRDALTAAFVFDDHLFLSQTCWRIDSVSELPSVVSTPPCNYRPVRFLSLAIDHLFWGVEPMGYHLTNWLLHGLNVLLVLALVFRLTKSHFGAVCAALLWGLHPVHTDCVTYVAGRRDLLVAFFVILGLLVWPKKRGTHLALVRILLTVCCLGLAFFSKESGVVLPALLCLMLVLKPSFSAVNASEPAPSVWRELVRLMRTYWVPFMLLGLLAIAAVIYRGFLAPATVQGALWGGDLKHHVMSVFAAYSTYLELVFAPLGLYGDYSDFSVPMHMTDPRVLVGLLCLLVIWGAGCLLLRRAPFVSFGLLWFGLAMLPVSQIIPHHELIAEHYLYLPLMGFAVPVAHVFGRLASNKWSRLGVTALTVGVGGWYVGLVNNRNVDFQSEEAFALAVLEEVPNSFRGRLTLANAYQMEDRWEEAARVFDELITEVPQHNRFFYKSWNGSLVAHASLGHLQEAEQRAMALIDIYPNDPSAYDILATIDIQRGRVEAALDNHFRAFELAPNNVEIRLHFGTTLMRLERYEDAEPHLSFAAAQWPSSVEAHLQWALVAFHLGQRAVAKTRLVDVLALDPNNVYALTALIQIAQQERNQSDACRWFRRLLPLRAELSELPDPCEGIEGALQ